MYINVNTSSETSEMTTKERSGQRLNAVEVDFVQRRCRVSGLAYIRYDEIRGKNGKAWHYSAEMKENALSGGIGKMAKQIVK